MHRDIKPENFLIKDDNTGHDMLKLGDFGLTRQVNEQANLTEYVGTRWYRAPEISLSMTPYTAKFDIFALGCIMAELYLGRPIFPGRTSIEQIS